MLPVLRRKKLAELIEKKKLVYMQEMMDCLNISESTLRRDLKCLEGEGSVVLLRGGAAQCTADVKENGKKPTVISLPEGENNLSIAKKAAGFIEENDVVFLSRSPYNMLIAEHLHVKSLTVVTNSLRLVPKLVDKGWQIILIGGQLDTETMLCTGVIAESAMNELHYTKAFFCAQGIDAKMGITCRTPAEKAVINAISANSGQIYALASTDAFDHTEMCRVLSLAECTIITDKCPKKYAALRNIVLAE